MILDDNFILSNKINIIYLILFNYSIMNELEPINLFNSHLINTDLVITAYLWLKIVRVDSRIIFNPPILQDWLLDIFILILLKFNLFTQYIVISGVFEAPTGI